MSHQKPFRLIYLRPPFGYPSSWLVFLHLIKWNCMRSFDDLRRQLEVDGGYRIAANHWWDGAQVPHWKVEDACGLNRNELKYSFLDGWFPIPKPWECPYLSFRPRARIRHCAQCIKFGYHSAVFYFEGITRCPWHGEALLYCECCSEFLEKTYNKKKLDESAQCDHLATALGRVAAAKVPDEFICLEKQWCSEHRDWVRNAVRLIGQAAYEVIAARSLGNQLNSMVLKYLADRLWMPDLRYEFTSKVSVLKLPLSRLIWEVNYQDELHDWGVVPQRASVRRLQPQTSAAEEAAMAKSVRRYVFRQFLRRHRKCLSRLAARERVDWLSLNLSGTCPVVLAYLVIFSRRWGVSPIEFLNSSTSHVRSYEDHFVRRGETLKCESELAMYELLGNFYRMWSELRHWHDSDFRTFAITYRYERGAPGFSKAVYESGMMGRGYFYWDIYLFMEDQNETLAASLPDCKLRRAEPLTVQLAEYEASVLATNQNVLIALHNVHSGNDRRCHL